MSDPKSKLAEAKSEYIALAKEFSKKVNKAMLALSKHNDVQLPFDLESRSWSQEIKTVSVKEIVDFLKKLGSGDAMPDFFHFDIEARTKSKTPQLIKDSTIEVAIPQNRATERTRSVENPARRSSGTSDGWKDDYLISKRPRYIKEQLDSKTISEVFGQLQEDLRKQLKKKSTDKTAFTNIAACIDAIKEELDRSALPEAATRYLNAKEHSEKKSKPKATISPAKKVEKAIAEAKAKLA